MRYTVIRSKYMLNEKIQNYVKILKDRLSVSLYGPNVFILSDYRIGRIVGMEAEMQATINDLEEILRQEEN